MSNAHQSINQCSSSNQTFPIIFPTRSNAMQDSMQSVKVKIQINPPLVFSPAPLLQLPMLPIPYNHDDEIKYKIENIKCQFSQNQVKRQSPKIQNIKHKIPYDMSSKREAIYKKNHVSMDIYLTLLTRTSTDTLGGLFF